ncbi:MAG: alpha/beta hydrolase [Actinomycetaceae bacterium]|nr:alpha/beta hydrolase [Actinomycetaceae bacterium]
MARRVREIVSRLIPARSEAHRRDGSESAARRARRPQPMYYGARRVPETMWLIDAMDALMPLARSMTTIAFMSLVADHAPLPPAIRQPIQSRIRAQGEEFIEQSQKTFFNHPGLDTLVVQAACRGAMALTTVGRGYLRARIALGFDPKGTAAQTLPLVPHRGYESLMGSYLAIGTALGWFRGGRVRVRPLVRNGESVAAAGESALGIRRLQGPRGLVDMAADIDDLYWAQSQGAVIKITAVGKGASRRWIVSVPGTDHVDPHSTPNPADTETNIREMLGLPSAMRLGVVAAVHHAMRSEGVDKRDLAREPVLMMGHSQGGVVGLALLGRHPRELNIRGLVTLGTPGRRLRVPRDVTAIAIEHDQDIVPSLDARPRRGTNDRIVIGRFLNRPRVGPLYYAHSSTTYTETVELMERRARVAPYGKTGRAWQFFSEFFASAEETQAIYFYEIRQDILTQSAPAIEDTFDFLADVRSPDDLPIPGFTPQRGINHDSNI